jgi:GTP-binding protein Era
VGKSTLLNALVGRKLAIVTPKPQTTRFAVQGVVNRAGGQLVFVDTPGFFKTHASELVENLHARAREALEGVDVVVHVVDPSRAIGAEDELAAEAVRTVPAPKILCLNKADLRERPCREEWFQRAAAYQDVVEVSAQHRLNLPALVEAVFRFLPEGPPLYAEAGDATMERAFWIGEIIREKIYLLTQEEVPYRTGVEVHGVETRQDRTGRPLLYVKGSILTADGRYQRMLIGAKGAKIKEIGMAARRELEAALGTKVFLDLDVVIDTTLPV